jgi:hypothetical protein
MKHVLWYHTRAEGFTYQRKFHTHMYNTQSDVWRLAGRRPSRLVQNTQHAEISLLQVTYGGVSREQPKNIIMLSYKGAETYIGMPSDEVTATHAHVR